MNFCFQRMSAEEFATFQCALGERVIERSNVYWKRVRPFFYRPLLPFREFSPEVTSAPLQACLGGFQFAVPPESRGNSFLNLLIYKDTEKYSLDALDRRKRQQVRSAAAKFIIRPIENAEEFKQKAFPVYLSFFERTGYTYKSERRNHDSFSRWADTLFRFPKVAILGAYHNGELGGVSISEFVEDTLVYSTAFCDNDSFRLHVTSLMLHCLQEAAADCPEMKCIFAGPYKYQGRNGVDKFHLDRGCSLVKKPALVSLNPLARVYLRHFKGNVYEKLIGQMESTSQEEDLLSNRVEGET